MMWRLTRLIAAGCVVLVVASGCSKSKTESGSAPPKEFTAATIDKFVADLAKAGVAVYPTGSSTPVVKVDAPGPVALSQDQAGSAALGAWAHAGLTGADIDKLATMPPLAEGAQPIPAGLFIAAWSQVAPGPRATMAKDLLGKQDWARYQAAVFPSAVLALFAADVAAMGGNAAGAGGGGSVIEKADSVCEQFKGFIFGTIERVFAAIGRFELKGFTGNVLKDIFIFIKNTGAVLGNLALDTVKFVVVNGVEVALGPILNGIAAVASVAAVVTNIVLILQPWTADVRPDPLISRRSESANPGTVKLTMRGITGQNDWPTELTGCARAAGVTLPSLKPKDADLTWTITNQHPAPMIVKKSETAVLKDDGTATMQFETLPESPEVAKGEEKTDGIALLDIAVHRKDLDKVHKLITEEIFKLLPSLVDKTFGGAIRAVINPQIQKLLQPLTTLRDMTVKTVIPVNYHTKTDEKTSKPGTGPGGKRGSVPTICPGVDVITKGFHRPPDGGPWEFDGDIIPSNRLPAGWKTCGYSAWLGPKDNFGFQQVEQVEITLIPDPEPTPPSARRVDIPGTDRAWFDGILKVVVDGRMLAVGCRIRTTEDQDATTIAVAKYVLGVA